MQAEHPLHRSRRLRTREAYIGFIPEVEEDGAGWSIVCGVPVGTVANIIAQLERVLSIWSDALHNRDSGLT